MVCGANRFCPSRETALERALWRDSGRASQALAARDAASGTAFPDLAWTRGCVTLPVGRVILDEYNIFVQFDEFRRLTYVLT